MTFVLGSSFFPILLCLLGLILFSTPSISHVLLHQSPWFCDPYPVQVWKNQLDYSFPQGVPLHYRLTPKTKSYLPHSPLLIPPTHLCWWNWDRITAFRQETNRKDLRALGSLYYWNLSGHICPALSLLQTQGMFFDYGPVLLPGSCSLSALFSTSLGKSSGNIFLFNEK